MLARYAEINIVYAYLLTLLTANEIRKMFVTLLVFLSAVAIVINVTIFPILPKAIHKA